MAGQGFAIQSEERGMLTKTTFPRDQGSRGDMRIWLHGAWTSFKNKPACLYVLIVQILGDP